MNPGLKQLRDARKILGVNCQATKVQIKRAFKQKALLKHPDHVKPRVNLPPSQIRTQFSNLVKSYKLLMEYTSPAQKNRYNGARDKARLRFALARIEDVSHKFHWQKVHEILLEWQKERCG